MTDLIIPSKLYLNNSVGIWNIPAHMFLYYHNLWLHKNRIRDRIFHFCQGLKGTEKKTKNDKKWSSEMMNARKKRWKPIRNNLARKHFCPCRIKKRVRLDVKSHAEVCNVCFCAVTEDQHWKRSSGCASKSHSYTRTTNDHFINPNSQAGIFLIRWAFILQWPPFTVCHAGRPPARLTS